MSNLQPSGQNIVLRDITEELQTSFLEYSMSVITSRALPDVRDGLKPVHRRILYGMYSAGNPTTLRKSAKVVGEIMGNFHPHGDAAIYGTLVRMAQDFSTRYLLAIGQGNFGSVDGDPPAAMRYTEIKMSPLALEMVRDIDKNTVEFVPNYDGTQMEPSVLPCRLPNLLMNGTQGIAVGMATHIPPHNLKEILDAILFVIDNNEQYTTDDLLNFIKGPDFPTGAVLVNGQDLKKIYKTGSGTIVLEAKTEIEEIKGSHGKKAIIIKELPYMCNKAKLVEKIADLVKEKKVDGITDLRDESDRHGIRVVIELKRDAQPEVILEQLMKQTSMRTNLSIKFLVLKDRKPVVLDLKGMIQAYLDHQVEVVTNRIKHDLDNVNNRIHIVQGLIKALDRIEEVVQLIKNAQDTDQARAQLMEQLQLSETQASAILSMTLSRLTSLETNKFHEELNKLYQDKATYEHQLSSRQNVLQVIKEELIEASKKFMDERRTEIAFKDPSERSILDTIPDEKVLVSVTHKGYIKRAPESGIAKQRRGNRGRVMTRLADEDFVTQVFSASTRDSVLMFTDSGMAYKINVYEIPDRQKNSKGVQVGSLMAREMKDEIKAIVPIHQGIKHLLFITKRGFMKKVAMSDFDNITRAGLCAMYVRENDALQIVLPLKENDEILVCTKEGNALRFNEKWMQTMSRDSYGVLGIFMDSEDQVVDADVIDPAKTKVVVVTADGYGKTVALDEYRSQRHGGRGIRTTHTKNSKGALVGLKIVQDDDELVIVTDKGEINRQPVADITEYSRYAQGVRLMTLNGDAKVVSVSTLAADDEE